VDFKFDSPSFTKIEIKDCGTYGDRNYKQFGVVSGAYIKHYLIFKLTDIYNKVMYLLIEEDFWEPEYEVHTFEFEFDNRKITVESKLNNGKFYLISEDKLLEFYEYMDEI
jgi:hypothetical protein